MSYFKRNEFTCPCCGETKVSAWLIHLLNEVRLEYGKPMVVNSGYRCEKRNKAVGGQPHSAHMKGVAADIRCGNSSDRFKLVGLALAAGFKRIGIADSFVHLDVDGGLSQEVLWNY